MSNTCKILIVDDEEQLLSALAGFLGDRFEVHTTETIDGAKEQLNGKVFDIILLDVRLDNGVSGLDLLPVVQDLNSPPSVILMSAYIDKPIAIKATNNGAVGILEKPFEPTAVTDQIGRVLKFRSRQSQSGKPVSIGNQTLSLDSNNFRLRTANGSLTLTKTEFQILSVLMAKPNQWIQRESIESQIWPGIQVSRNTLDTHFTNLKKRIPEIRNFFESRRGFGIRFIENQNNDKT